MKLSDYLNDHTPFVNLENLGDVELLPIFTICTGAELDAMLNIEYGDKTLFSKILKQEDDFHVKSIVAKYKRTWLKLLELSNIDIKLGATNQRILKETITDKVTSDNTQNVENKVSAYNDDSLIVDTGNDTTGQNNSDGLKERTLEDANLNINSAINQLTAYQKSSIITSVLSSVSDYYTTSIY